MYFDPSLKMEEMTTVVKEINLHHSVHPVRNTHPDTIYLLSHLYWNLRTLTELERPHQTPQLITLWPRTKVGAELL